MLLLAREAPARMPKATQDTPGDPQNTLRSHSETGDRTRGGLVVVVVVAVFLVVAAAKWLPVGVWVG